MVIRIGCSEQLPDKDDLGCLLHNTENVWSALWTWWCKNNETSATTENHRIFGSAKIDRKPKRRKGLEAILKNFMAVKSVKFLWWIR